MDHNRICRCGQLNLLCAITNAIVGIRVWKPSLRFEFFHILLFAMGTQIESQDWIYTSWCCRWVSAGLSTKIDSRIILATKGNYIHVQEHRTFTSTSMLGIEATLTFSACNLEQFMILGVRMRVQSPGAWSTQSAFFTLFTWKSCHHPVCITHDAFLWLHTFPSVVLTRHKLNELDVFFSFVCLFHHIDTLMKSKGRWVQFSKARKTEVCVTIETSSDAYMVLAVWT